MFLIGCVCFTPSIPVSFIYCFQFSLYLVCIYVLLCIFIITHAYMLTNLLKILPNQLFMLKYGWTWISGGGGLVLHRMCQFNSITFSMSFSFTVCNLVYTFNVFYNVLLIFSHVYMLMNLLKFLLIA